MRMASVALVLLAGAAPAVAQTRTCRAEALNGQWSGGGIVRRDPDSPEEPVRCRLAATWSGPQRTLSLRFDCRGMEIGFTMTGAVRVDRASGAVTGKLAGVQTTGIRKSGDSTVAGQCQGHFARLALTYRNLRSGNRETSMMTMDFRNARAMRVSLLAPAASSAGSGSGNLTGSGSGAKTPTALFSATFRRTGQVGR